MSEELSLLPDAPLGAKPELDSALEALPSATSRLERVFQDVGDAQPDQAAKVLSLAKQTGEPPAFIDKNMAAVETAAKVPPLRPLFQEMTRSAPTVERFLSDPRNMAASLDDIRNLHDFEKGTRDFGFAESMYRSLLSGVNQLNASLARLPATALDTALLPGNLFYKAVGRPDLQGRSPDWLANNPVATYYDEAARAASTPDMERSILQEIGRGQYGSAGRALASQFVANAPNQAALIVATLTGYGAPALAGAGALQAADALKRGREAGADPANAALNAVTQGSAEALFERLGTFGILTHWEGVIARAYGKQTARSVMKDVGRTLVASFAGEANEEFLTQAAQDFSDYATGVNPRAMEGALERAINAGIVGGFSGTALTGPSAVSSGVYQGMEAQKAERAKQFYLSLGANAEAAKLRERLPEAHRKLADEITKFSPVENVYIAAEAVERYFQSKNVDPNQLMQELGVAESYLESQATGAPLKIPLAAWAEKVATDPAYKDLADDIKFDPEDLSVNEVKQRQEEVRAEMESVQAQAQQAVSADVKVKAGYEMVLADVKTKLSAIARPVNIKEKDWVKLIDANAQITASHAVAEARRRGVTVEEYYSGPRRPDIVAGEQPAPGALQQPGALLEERAPTVLAEAIPAPELAHPIMQASLSTRTEFTQRAMRLLQGIDKALGVELIGTEQGTGFFEGAASPNFVTSIKATGEDAADAKAADRYARAVQFVFRQKAVPWMRVQEDGPFAAILVRFENIDQSTESAFGEALKKALQNRAGYTKLNSQEIVVVNYGGIPDAEFYGALDQIDIGQLGAQGFEQFRSGGDYGPEHDWGADPQGLGLLGAEGGPGVLQEARRTLLAAQAGFDRLLAAYKDEPLRQEGVASSAAPFYSKLQRDVESKLGPTATVEQVRALLREAKEDERKWSGIDEFLEGKAKVNRDELLAFLKANQLQIEEVVKGNRDPSEFNERYNEWVRNLRANKKSGFARNPYDLKDEGKLTKKELEQLEAFNAESKRDTDSSTKFGTYTLSGGANYRELLLTFPFVQSDRQRARVEALHKKRDEIFDRWKANDWNPVEAAQKDPQGDKELTAANQELNEIDPEAFGDAGPRAFQTRHFDESNILAHVRFNERTDSAGKRVLFLEEVQSDWHQRGRREGYRGKDKGPLPDNFRIAPEEVLVQRRGKPDSREIKYRVIIDGIGHGASFDTAAEAEDYARQHYEAKGVPDAPFKKTWHEFALKRMIRWAAEKGFDKIAWTTGEQQADRYDLSKQISTIRWYPKSGKLLAFKAGERGGNPAIDRVVPKEDLAEFIGKEAAEKILASKAGFDPHTEPGGSEVHILSNADLKVGGEGMKGFYDKIIPAFLSKFGKKFGAEVGEARIIQSGADLHAENIEDARNAGLEPEDIADAMLKVHSLTITPELKRAALEEGFPLFQGEGQQPRGFFDPAANLIGLMKTADASTLLHESAHVWLKDMHGFVRSGQATEEYLEDWRTLASWLGVKDDQEKLTVEQQEKFARAFEAYLREGNAPSQGLRGAFVRLRRWLTKLYKDARASLGVELNDDIRGVMDRMLATEEEIEAATSETGYKFAEIPGADPAVTARIRYLQEKARTYAEEILLKEQMAELAKAQADTDDKARAKFAREAEELLSRNSLYEAQDYLRRQFGIASDKFTERTVTNAAGKFVSRTLDDERTAAIEAAAELHGFADGMDLARKLVAAKPLDRAVADIVEQRMKSLAEPNRLAMRERARELIYSDEGKLVELLALEREELSRLSYKAEVQAEASRRRRTDARVEAAAIKAQAREMLAGKPVREATAFRPYVTAEKAAAVRGARALADGDLPKAAQFKRQEALNHALASEAYRNRNESDRIERVLWRFARRGGELLKMPYGFVRQIDALISRVGMAPPRTEQTQTLAAIAGEMMKKGSRAEEIANATGLVGGETGQWRPERIDEFLNRVNENYYALTLPDSVLQNYQPWGTEDQLFQPAFGGVTMGELRDIRTAVQALNDVGRNFQSFVSGFVKGDIREASRKLRQSIEERIGTPYAEKLRVGSQFDSKFKERIDALLSLPDAAIADMVNLLTLTKYLDGGAEDGPATEYIYRTLKKAEDRKLVRYEKMTADVNALFAKFFTPEELGDYKNQRAYYNAIGRYLTREEVLAFGFNWGNEGNRDRIREGFQIDDVQVQTVLDNLTEKEVNFIQEVWNYLDSYWPEIVALDMLTQGIEPERVQRVPWKTRYGTLEGGYYPLAYDFEKSSDAYRNAQEKNALYKQYSTAGAHTDRGHAKARVGYLKRPVRLSLDVFFNHLENVVHDLEFRPAVIDVARFLRETDTKEAIEAAVGVHGFRAINESVKAIASDQGEFMSFADKAFRWFRFKATFATLGYRLFTLPLDTTGNVFNAIWEIGPTRTAAAMKEFVMDPSATVEFVNAKSERMRRRAKLRDRDMMDISRKWDGNESAFTHYTFIVQVLADEAVSYPLWLEVYNHSVEKHGEAKAKEIADEAVARTLGSGSMLDQVAAQRGGEGKKILTMYYTWLSMMFNRAWLDGRLAGLQYDKGNLGAALGIIAKTTLFAWGLQALNENFWRELFRNSAGDDEEERKRRVMARVLQQPFAYVWIARDIAGYAIEKATGKYDARYRISPLESAVETVFDPLARGVNIAFSNEKEYDTRFAESLARSAAFMTGFPIAINNLVFNFIDWIGDNGEWTWRDGLTRRTKK